MKCDRVLFSGHAVQRMFQRGINRSAVLAVISGGEVIADYTDDTPYPSCVMLDFVGGKPVHVVVAVDTMENMCYVVTAYVPNPDLWSDDFKTRRPS